MTLRNQQLTHTWWNTHRERYALYTSDLAEEEAAKGDPIFARQRLALLMVPALLPPQPEEFALASALFTRIPLPLKAEADSLHVAIAAVHGMAYLLTWNCTHIANPKLRVRIERICAALGFTAPALLTPAQLMGE